MTQIFQFTALLLIPLLVRAPLSAQAIGQNAASLRMRVLSDSPGKNALGVEVTDAQGVPVPGAVVTFRLPEDGLTGKFGDGSRIAVANTDQSGQARVTGILWSAAGTASVRVTATKGTAHAGILVERQAEIQQEAAITPKPAQNVAARSKPPDQKPISPKPAPQEVAAVRQAPVVAVPAIEPPHVSITSVSRKQPMPGQLSTAAPAGSVEPSVAITGAGQRTRGGSKKWIILAAIAAGAGAGAAIMMSRGKSSTAASTTSSSGVSIGAPSISIGAPSGSN